MREALASQPEVVFAAGGDGTLRAVAEALRGTGVAMGVIPGGTMNRLAERLGLPADPVEAVARYRPGRVAAFDLATANDEVFLYQAIAGRTARLLRFREMQRDGTSWLPLIVAALRALFRPPARHLTLVAPGLRGLSGRRPRGHTAVVTTPADGGTLEVDLVRHGSVLGRLMQAIRWVRQGLAEDPGVRHARLSRVAVLVPGRGVRLSLDGEMRMAAPPLHFRLHRGALRVLSPIP